LIPVERAEEQLVVFLRRDPADVDDDGIGRSRAPGLPEPRVASRGGEELHIHAAGQEPDVFVACALESAGEFPCRHEGARGAIVHAPQPRGHQSGQPAETVVPGVLVEVGVETGGDRNPELAGGGDGGGAQGAFRRHVHEVGAFPPPDLQQPEARRQADADLRVPGHGDSRQADLPAGEPVGDAEARRFVPLSRPDDRDLVAPGGESVDQPPERHGDAIDLGGVGFGDEGQVHVSAGEPKRIWQSSRTRDAGVRIL
jgi:hypothetical protein